MQNLFITASSYAHAGLSVIPTLADKRPACAWKPFTERIMSERELETAFGRSGRRPSATSAGRDVLGAPLGIGIVCGKVSGNLELLDFDDRGSRFEPWFCAIPEYLAKRLVIETTPSGGKHVYYRVDQGGVPGNRKLAMKADGHVLIETRGEGGYVKCAPSAGYELMAGNFLNIPTVSPFEQKIMIDAAMELDERGKELGIRKEELGIRDKELGMAGGKLGTRNEELGMAGGKLGIRNEELGMAVGSGFGSAGQQSKGENSAIHNSSFIVPHSTPHSSFIAPHSTPHSPVPLRVTSPIDVMALMQALGNAGWKKVRDGKEQHWERPGKDERSTSATFNGDVFYVFSSNAAPFEPNRGYSVRSALRLLGSGGCELGIRKEELGIRKEELGIRNEELGMKDGSGSGSAGQQKEGDNSAIHNSSFLIPHSEDSEDAESPADPGPIPEELLHVPGFVDLLAEHTLACAPYPNRTLAFAGALTMLAHLTGRNFRDPRNLRTNLYLIALADSGVGKDFPRKVNMNLAAELNVMGGMADRFASAEGLEDALLVRPCSFFQVDEVDTLFASLADRGDSSMEKIYGALLQFATSSDTIYAMRKKAIQQTGGKAGKFDKIRARGIREPHLTLLGTAIPKYLFSAVSERAMENGLLSRCLVIEAGTRGKAGTPHFAPFDERLLEMARYFVSLGGFDGLDLENLDETLDGRTPPDVPGGPHHPEPYTVSESPEAETRRNEVTARCEELYEASTTTAEKSLWSRGAEKTARLALLYALSENPYEPLITDAGVEWAWKVVEHLTKRLLFQASVYVHDNEFDALRQKALRYLRDYGQRGSLTHGALLRYLHIDSDTFRKVIDTLVQSELIVATQLSRGGFRYSLVGGL